MLARRFAALAILALLSPGGEPGVRSRPPGSRKPAVAHHERVSNDLREQAERDRDAAEKAREGEKKARSEVEREREKLAIYDYGRSMQVAFDEWRDARLAEARALLAGADPRLRGWEWHYLHRLCHADMLTIETPARIVSAAFSPDGSSVLTANLDGTVTAWGADTGERGSALALGRGLIRVTPDASGERILVTDIGAVRFVDAKTGGPALRLRRGEGRSVHPVGDVQRGRVAGGGESRLRREGLGRYEGRGGAEAETEPDDRCSGL